MRAANDGPLKRKFIEIKIKALMLKHNLKALMSE